jgi:hypothetical protein
MKALSLVDTKTQTRSHPVKSAYKKNKHTGPGGMGCPCCAPSPKHRKAFLRADKKAERVVAFKQQHLPETEEQPMNKKALTTQDILLSCLDVSRGTMDSSALKMAEDVYANSTNTPRASLELGREIEDTYICLGWAVPSAIAGLIDHAFSDSMDELG